MLVAVDAGGMLLVLMSLLETVVISCINVLGSFDDRGHHVEGCCVWQRPWYVLGTCTQPEEMLEEPLHKALERFRELPSVGLELLRETQFLVQV